MSWSRLDKCIITLNFMAVLSVANSARILCFFQIPAPSHQFIFRAVMEELAKVGHEIVYVTPMPYEKPPTGISQIVLPKFSYGEEHEVDFVNHGKQSLLGMWKQVQDLGDAMGHLNLASEAVQELIHSEQRFDIVMFETFLSQEYLAAFIHKFNAVGIELATSGEIVWCNELAGLSDNPAYQLSTLIVGQTDMNFWQRLYSTYAYGIELVTMYYNWRNMQVIMDKYFNYTGWETRPPLHVLARNRSLVLSNFDAMFGHPYPSPPHRKDIAGIHIKPNKPLPKDFQTFIDESKEGVIYMSLGTHLKASDILKEIKIFMSVFKNLNQRVLLKYDGQYPDEVPPNVKLSQWFPQQDILAHKHCVLFITHGGLLSLTESTYYGIPFIGVPFFVDQPRNVQFAESRGFGRMLKFENITHEAVSWLIREVLHNNRYAEAAVRRSKMFKDRRHTPSEEVVYWVGHSLKHPFALTPKSVFINPIQLHMIDISIFLVSVLLIIIFGLYLVLKSTCNLVRKINVRNKV